MPTPSPAPSFEAVKTPEHEAAHFLGTETGLLIGLRADESEDDSTSPSAYRTLWLSNDGEGLKVLPFDRIIVTPRTKDDPKRQLWAFKPVLHRTATDSIQAIEAGLLTDTTVSAPIADDMDENVVMAERLTFVGEDMAGLKVSASYWAGNGNAYSESAWVKGFKQFGPSKRYNGFSWKWDDNAHLRIQDALGDKLTAEYRNDDTVRAMEADRGGLKLAQPLGDNWIVERDGHMWTPKIVGLFDYPASGYATDALPSRLLDVAQPIEETPNWTAVQLAQSGVKDTFLSDARDYILIQTADALYLYAYVDDAPNGLPVWTLELKPGETVVMCKWFAGEAKPHWAERFNLAYGAGNFAYPGYTDQP